VSARRTGISLVALVIASITTRTARAADIPVIRVFPPQCEAAPLSADDFVDALRVELAGRQPHCCVVGPGGDGSADAVRVTLSIEPCDAATEQVGITVDVTDPPRTVERQVSLADLPPEARSRALALAVAELIRSATEPAQSDAGAPPRDHPPVAPPRGVTVTGGVAGEVRRHFSRDTTLWGPRLALSLSSTRWQVTVDAGAAANRTDVYQGELSILVASAALFVGPRFVRGPVITSVGPAAALGWARIKGQSDVPNIVPASGSNLVSTLGLRAAAEGPASGVIRLFGYAEGGFTLLGLDAKVLGQTATGVSGPYLMLAAGVRFGPAE
jgi:hypothetical protein